VTGGITRNHLVNNINNEIYEIEKPTGTGVLSVEWFTVLANYQSAVQTDVNAISANSLETNRNLRVLFNKDSEIKVDDLAFDFDVANALIAKGVTVAVPVIVEIHAAAGATITDIVATRSDDATVTTTEAAHATAIALVAGKNLVQVGTVATSATAAIGDWALFTLTISGNTFPATGAGGAYRVIVSEFPDVVELGAQKFATSADTAIDTENYKFVNLSMQSTGPSALINNLNQVRAAILLDDVATAGRDGVVVMHSGGKTTSASGSAGASNNGDLQTAYVNYLTDNEIKRYYSYENSGAYLFDLDTRGARQADLGYSTTDGLLRDALEISSSTVVGDYVLTFKADGLEKKVTLRVKNPAPQVNLASTYLNSNNNKVNNGPGTPANEYYSLDEEKSFISVNTSKFVELNDDGVYKVERATGDYLKAKVDVHNLPVGSYTYSIVKSYPDGRTDTFSDIAVVSSLDTNGKSIFAEDSGTASARAFNVLFNDRWFIDTAASIERGAVGLLLGTYKYTFTIGTVTNEFEILVVDPEKLTATSLTIGSTTINVFDASYLATTTSILGAASYAFTKYELSDDNFFTLSMTKTGSLTVTQPYETDVTSLKGLSSISLGTIAGTAAVGDTVTATIKFFERVTWLENNDTFVEIGQQVLTIRAGSNPAPIVSVGNQTVVGAALTAALTTTESATYAVTTANLADGTTLGIVFFSDAAGTLPIARPAALTASFSALTSNASTLTITELNSLAATYYFRVTVNGVSSEVKTVVVA
jgi:hypothetical protein